MTDLTGVSQGTIIEDRDRWIGVVKPSKVIL